MKIKDLVTYVRELHYTSALRKEVLENLKLQDFQPEDADLSTLPVNYHYYLNNIALGDQFCNHDKELFEALANANRAALLNQYYKGEVDSLIQGVSELTFAPAKDCTEEQVASLTTAMGELKIGITSPKNMALTKYSLITRVFFKVKQEQKYQSSKDDKTSGNANKSVQDLLTESLILKTKCIYEVMEQLQTLCRVPLDVYFNSSSKEYPIDLRTAPLDPEDNQNISLINRLNGMQVKGMAVTEIKILEPSNPKSLRQYIIKAINPFQLRCNHHEYVENLQQTIPGHTQQDVEVILRAIQALNLDHPYFKKLIAYDGAKLSSQVPFWHIRTDGFLPQVEESTLFHQFFNALQEAKLIKFCYRAEVQMTKAPEDRRYLKRRMNVVMSSRSDDQASQEESKSTVKDLYQTVIEITDFDALKAHLTKRKADALTTEGSSQNALFALPSPKRQCLKAPEKEAMSDDSPVISHFEGPKATT